MYDQYIAEMIGVDLTYSEMVFRDSKSSLRHYINNRNKSEGLLFSSDWNWLMAVVNFINDRDWVTIYMDICRIHSLVIGEFEEIIITDNDRSLIRAVHIACGKYAKWYIDNNKHLK